MKQNPHNMNASEKELDYPLGEHLPQPGAITEVAAGVYWLRMVLPFALDHINLWLLRDHYEGREGWAIVDCCLDQASSREQWQQIFETGLEGLPVLRVFVTHLHPDHLGLAHWLCDYWKVPLNTLSSVHYIANRMSDFIPGKASKSAEIKAGDIKESEETTHISIYDKEGNMVSITTTLNGGYGSKTVVSGAGFLLNNEMDDFSVKPGVANMFGAVGGEANAIIPGKRMLSSMCPVIVTKNGKPAIVVGTPGGTTIPTSVYQALVNSINFGMNIDDAINKPKFHHQHLPDEVYIEPNFPSALKDSLISMGYKMTNRASIGKTEMIMIHKDKIEVAADRRGDDSVAGF